MYGACGILRYGLCCGLVSINLCLNFIMKICKRGYTVQYVTRKGISYKYYDMLLIRSKEEEHVDTNIW